MKRSIKYFLIQIYASFQNKNHLLTKFQAIKFLYTSLIVVGGAGVHMVAKRFQNPKGGLNQKGRDFFKRKEGSNLKRPLKTGTSPRRVSFAARFGGMKGALKDEKGRPTRLKLALNAWGFSSKEQARAFANRNKKK